MAESTEAPQLPGPDETITLNKRRLFRLGCQIIHRANLARAALDDKNETKAIANYFAMDTELMGRAFTIMSQEDQDLLAGLVAAAGNEGK